MAGQEALEEAVMARQAYPIKYPTVVFLESVGKLYTFF
jgi:hypothetical protein